VKGAAGWFGARVKAVAGFFRSEGVVAEVRTAGIAPGSLSVEATRRWYHSELASISARIDSSLPLREQALRAFHMRNEIKLQARSLMADRVAAEGLPPTSTLQDVVKRAYDRGLRGDEVWKYVLDGSQRSNGAVDAALGLTR
jgi:hypothetical protein